MTTGARERPWLDELDRKHECGPSLSPYRTLELHHEGRPIRVRIPDNLINPDRLEIRATLCSDSLLVLLGHHTMKRKEPYERGVLMVARAREEGGPYVVHVWHEMYPWALQYLGLDEPAAIEH
jgi:hypothetical protein